MNKVLIGLGTNLGDRLANLTKAYDEIEQRIGRIKLKSSHYQTPPWGFESVQDFFNSVIEVETELDPTKLFLELKRIESEMGRATKKKNDPYEDRPIDLDILDFNNDAFTTKELIIPHDKMHVRSFVLYPLAEIAPDWAHPLLNKSAIDLIKTLISADEIVKLP